MADVLHFVGTWMLRGVVFLLGMALGVCLVLAVAEPWLGIFMRED